MGSEAVADEVAKVCAAREAVRELKRRIEERKAQVDAAAQDETLQSMKAQVVEDQSNKKNREREKVVAEMTKCENDEKELLEKMNEIRQRDTVLEHGDILKTKSDAESLKYLTCMVNTVQEPWRILVEVARLRDYHRAQLDGWRRDSASCSRQHREARSQLEAHKRKVMELEKELERGSKGARLRDRDPLGRETVPVVKRMRTPLQLTQLNL